MTNIPTSVGSGLITGQFLIGTADTVDADSIPDASPITGIITFTPSVPFIRVPTGGTNPQTILLAPVFGVLDAEGYLCRNYIDPISGTYVRGVPLIATDTPNVTPEGWVWNVTYDLTFGGSHVAGPAAHPLQVSPGQTQDLTLAAPVLDTGGVITLQGPSNTLTIGTVGSAPTGSATITGTSPNQTLNLVLPELSPEQAAFAIAMAYAL